MNTGIINAELQKLYPVYTKDNRERVSNYLHRLQLSQSDIVRLGKYWASCVKRNEILATQKKQVLRNKELAKKRLRR